MEHLISAIESCRKWANCALRAKLAKLGTNVFYFMQLHTKWESSSSNKCSIYFTIQVMKITSRSNPSIPKAIPEVPDYCTKIYE